MGVNTLKDTSLSPQLDAEVLLGEVLKQNRAWILTHTDLELTPEEDEAYQGLLKRRRQSEPIAYIIGKKEFYGRSFAVNQSVLIPRPETEQIIELLKKKLPSNTSGNIIDVGTGSGCLAITAALEFPGSTVYALDLSEEALKIAEENKKTYQATNVTIEQSDLLQYPLENSLQADAIVANLPYLTQKDLDDSPTSKDLTFEPQEALLANDDGLELIKKCTKQAVSVLNSGCSLYLEMLPEQIEIFTTWTKENKLPFLISLPDDLKGKKRIAVLRKN